MYHANDLKSLDRFRDFYFGIYLESDCEGNLSLTLHETLLCVYPILCKSKKQFFLIVQKIVIMTSSSRY